MAARRTTTLSKRLFTTTSLPAVVSFLLLICLLLISPTRGRTVAAEDNSHSNNGTNKSAPAGGNQVLSVGKMPHPVHAGVTEAPHEGTSGGGHENHTDGGGGQHGGEQGEKKVGGHGGTGHHDNGYKGIKVAAFNWHHVQQPFIITMVLIAAALLKLAFHHAGKLPNYVPESCVLIILGTIVGGILFVSGSNIFGSLKPNFFFLVLLPPYFRIERSSFPSFTSSLFFLTLLPPIILESAYSLYDRVFFDNLGTILLYAVVGTILNCFLIGPALFGLSRVGAMGYMGSLQPTFLQSLVFASLIVAVDPVAVLAIFQEIGVNNVLYFLVFGESLLNDAVTVVLYNMMKAFNDMGSENISVSQVFLGIASFFTISLLGMVIGIFYGILSALFTKYTSHVRVVEPLAIFTLAYASYLTADLFGFSGIISIFTCGLVQAHFAFHNVSHKSSTTILYFSKIMSTTSDCIIFMFLGLALWNDDHKWQTGFVIWSVVLCLLFRFISVYFLTYLANKIKRIRKIDYEEQFIMAYGGLRGAVAFSLVAMLEYGPKLPKDMQNMFETTTLVVVLFTVFVQGMTIKPLVKLLRIRKEGEKVVSLCDEITNHVTDHVMAGIEEVIGYSGRNRLREILDFYDDKYLKRLLQRSPLTKDEHIMELYKEIAIQDHYDTLATNVDMGRYSSQMMLYHPYVIPADYESCKGEEEDDAFVAMAQTHPELADRALDGHLYRRNTAQRGYYHPRSRAQTVPNRMLSDPGPEFTPGTVHDIEAGEPLLEKKDQEDNSDRELIEGQNSSNEVIMRVGFPRKTTSLDSEPPRIGDVTVGDLRKWLVKPASETLHQKHNKNILSPSAQPDLMHLLHEKQLRTTRYLRSLSVSMTPEGGSPVASPLPGQKGFVFPRQRSETRASVAYRRSFTPGSRVRYDSDGPLTGVRSRSRTETPSTGQGANMKYRSVSMGAVAAQQELEPICETDSARKSNGENGNVNGDPHAIRKERPASYSGSEPPRVIIDNTRTKRCLLSRQDKVRDVSPSKSVPSRDASPAKQTAAQSSDVNESVDAELPRVRLPPDDDDKTNIESETHL